MNTYVAIFMSVVFGIILILSVHEIGRTKGHAEAYEEAKEQLEKLEKFKEK
jgi:hypothetical protein